MLSFIEDNSHPFDYVERLEGVPEGVEARVVRIAPDLPFDAMVAMPPTVCRPMSKPNRWVIMW